ncbi:Holliday junction branch migration protein RuvA [candidate division KSB1 bacterium]|nr:Holliday junction branch migration protein RuvA [candidate division KSB1 bacterium]
MLAFIKGKLAHKEPTRVILENNGIGFDIHISVHSYRELANVSGEIQLFIYLHVREDLLQLFGFTTIDEKDLFLKLISISGIGPRTAQTILSGVTVDEFTDLILNEKIDELTHIPGVGKKTAQRLIFDLKDKLKSRAIKAAAVTTVDSESSKTVMEDAILALVSLGYSRQKAEESIKKAMKKHGNNLRVEDVVRLALMEI